MPNKEIVFELQNITKTYGKGRTAVHAVDSASLSIKKGEVILIMGPSGSGKTTLLSIAGGLLKPTKGKVNLNNVNIAKLTEKTLPTIRLKQIGFIFQSFNLLSALNALENVKLILKLDGVKEKEAHKIAADLLTDLGLSERLTHLPKQLSGGEKQRVAIARALINNPDIILADEPTANLDSKSGHNVMELLRKIAKEQGKALIIVSHDTRIRDIADRVLWLEDGKLHQRITNSKLAENSPCFSCACGSEHCPAFQN